MRNINSQFTISVEKDSNKVIGSSEEKFGGIRDGSLIKIGEDDNLYTIIGREDYLYIKNFSVKDSKTIIIDENVGVNLQNGDTIKVSFKEYELLMVIDIIDKGHSYEENSEINIEGGTANINIENGIGNGVILEIKEVDENGGITKLGIKNKGKYLIPPDNKVKVISVNGLNAILEVKFQEVSNRTIIERQIVYLNHKDNLTILTLNYSLPLSLKEGKFSTDKSSLLISPNYFEETKKNLNYQIIRDFSPSFNLPLMAKNSISQELIYNKMVLQLDKILKEISKVKN